jgi:hypothetical protein
MKKIAIALMITLMVVCNVGCHHLKTPVHNDSNDAMSEVNDVIGTVDFYDADAEAKIIAERKSVWNQQPPIWKR